MVGLALVVALAAGALGAAGASAMPGELTLDAGAAHTELAPGSFFEMATFKPVVLETSDGPIECKSESDFTGFSGHVLTNGVKTDELSLESGGFEFGEPCAHGGALGTAYIEPYGFPWTLGATIPGKVKVSGSPKLGLEINFASGAKCFFEKSKLRGTIPDTPEYGIEQPFEVKFESQKFARTKASDSSCPKSASLSAEFPENTNGAELVYDVARAG